VARGALQEEQFESEWEAAPTLGLVIALQVVLALVSRSHHWKTWDLPWWIWLLPVLPELVLLVLLTWHRPRKRLEEIGIRRTVSITVLMLISAANLVLLVAVLASLIHGTEKSGGQLLLKAATVQSTTIVAFGVWFWALDRGGPVRRTRANAPLPDFQFPQMDDPQFADRGERWLPRLFDYVYVSFTNSIAFSPTDTLPLSRRAKALMLLESVASAVTLLLVAARAVNIFK
jgi:hypothetical protein